MITLKLPRPLSADETSDLLSIGHELADRNRAYLEAHSALMALQMKREELTAQQRTARLRAQESLSMEDATQASGCAMLIEAIGGKLRNAEKECDERARLFSVYVGHAYGQVCQVLCPLLKEAFIDLARPFIEPFTQDFHQVKELIRDLPAFKDLLQHFTKTVRVTMPEFAQPIADELLQLIEDATKGNALWRFDGNGEIESRTPQLAAA